MAPRIKHWCETYGKPLIDCICPRKRRKLKVYSHFQTRPWEYAYGAAYTKKQFARMMGSNLYILGGSRAVLLEEDPKFIKRALSSPFKVSYPPEWLPFRKNGGVKDEG